VFILALPPEPCHSDLHRARATGLVAETIAPLL